MRSSSLAERFHPYRNSLSTLRLCLAGTVALVHASVIGFDHLPMVGNMPLGDLAVDAFFVLSGFLVTRSLLRLNSVPRYLWHRGLRILPGFWVCLVLTALIAAPLTAVLEGYPASYVFTTPHDNAWEYLLEDCTLLIRQFDIGGLPTHVPEPNAMDASLWTLFYEAACYGMLAGLGVLGVVRRRPFLVLALVGALWLATSIEETGTTVVPFLFVLRFSFMFLLGIVGWLYRERIPIGPLYALAALAAFVTGLFVVNDYRVVGGVGFAYLCLWTTVMLPVRTLTGSADLSYGLYVYHWPVQQLMYLVGLNGAGLLLFTGTTVAVALLIAWASWLVIEGPALRLKDAAFVDRFSFPVALQRERALATPD